MAYRGSIPLEDIGIQFDVDGGDALRVAKTIRLIGNFSQSEPVRLRRAAEFCPVGKFFTKGSLSIDDDIATVAGTSGMPAMAKSVGELVPAGTVRARYLRETKEYDDEGTLVREGEVEVYAECGAGPRTGRWTLLIGHSTLGWAPAPVPAFNAAVAASALASLRQLAPAALGQGCQVDILRQGGGDRDRAQAEAAAGVVNASNLLRRVVLPTEPGDADVVAIRAALDRDPLSSAIRAGGALVEEHIVEQSPG